MTSVRVMISGRVQGVGYRHWFQQTANSLRVSGWVRNLSDGRVEAEVSGEEDRVDALLEVAKDGPAFASVTAIERVGPAPVHEGPFKVAF